MIIRYPKNTDPDTAKDAKTAGSPAASGRDEACRCKETSEMTPRELLRLMMSDLTFWKKAKKE